MYTLYIYISQAMHKSSEWEDVLQSAVDEYGNTIAHLAAESGNVQVFMVRVSAQM